MGKARALVLFSGGLDSLLAAKLLAAQGIEVKGICYQSNFFGCDKAQQTAAAAGIDLMVVDIADDIAGLVKNPPSGYGKNLNPCIDCHSLMIRKTSAIMKEQGFDFIATGEVLGQRPFSQNREALGRVSKLAGVEVLRPLSAILLPETTMESSGLVDRQKLSDISGRSREQQFELAKKFGITNYPTPAGGCLLTDPDFCSRLMKMLDNWPDCDRYDIEILKFGRPYWFAPTGNSCKILVIIGRNQKDNLALEKNAQAGDLLIEMADEVGPTVLVRDKNNGLISATEELETEIPENLKMSELRLSDEKKKDDIIGLACVLTGWYSAKAHGKRIKFIIKNIK